LLVLFSNYKKDSVELGTIAGCGGDPMPGGGDENFSKWWRRDEENWR
jgi:hypothetical protein